MADRITQEEITQGIPDEFRAYFQINATPLPRSMQGIVEAFWTAVEVIGPSVWFSQPAHVIFGTAPWKISVSRGKLEYTPSHPDMINVHFEEWVFLDCNRMKDLPMEFQVVCILEELVRALMHVTNKKLVPEIVVRLYPKVRMVEGKYAQAE
ncbi:MAG: hypothetical protein CMO55_19640 [Verrucomicrobiales bacterium]|nr:hypothetical protein [Verrucomicrobiales bacterium]